MAGQRTPGIPFTLHREHLVLVDGAIGRLEGLVLLLDTGSGRTIVSAEVCASLGLTRQPTHLQEWSWWPLLSVVLRCALQPFEVGQLVLDPQRFLRFFEEARQAMHARGGLVNVSIEGRHASPFAARGGLVQIG